MDIGYEWKQTLLFSRAPVERLVLHDKVQCKRRLFPCHMLDHANCDRESGSGVIEVSS